MDDIRIVDLYWARDEQAISETDVKYGRMLRSTSFSIVRSEEDAGECLNDTYMAAWNSMPENRPQMLGAYLSKIIRRLSINRYRRSHREKRGGVDNLTDELSECIPGSPGVEDEIEKAGLARLIDGFLAGLSYEKRYVFVRRYFYSDGIEQICQRTGYGQSKVKSMLARIRNDLRAVLEKEGEL